jgi:hypothetical protein
LSAKEASDKHKTAVSAEKTLSAHETFVKGEIDGHQLARIIKTKVIKWQIFDPFRGNYV